MDSAVVLLAEDVDRNRDLASKLKLKLVVLLAEDVDRNHHVESAWDYK